MMTAMEWIRNNELPKPIQVIVGICREDNPADVDETYGEGTYKKLFPDNDDEGE